MGTVTVEWNGRTVEATRVDLLADATIELTEATVRRTEQARAAVVANGARPGIAAEVAARLSLRAEGLASSEIEGLRAPLADVVAAETDPSASGTAAWVADNLHVVTAALTDRGAITREILLGWHTRLMANAPNMAPHHIGAWRDTLGWVGGANPFVATHVAVPAEDIDHAMSDLFAFIARTDLDPVTQAAIAHSQFETIHPFADGNGRIGRVLIGRMLAQGCAVEYPPPVSVRFAADVGGYQAGLTLYRQGLVDSWVRWFADAVAGAAAQAEAVLDAVSDVERRWTQRLEGVRRDSYAKVLIGALGQHPVLSIDTAGRYLGVGRSGARNAILTLERLGIVSNAGTWSAGPGRPTRWWAATELLDLIGH